MADEEEDAGKMREKVERAAQLILFKRHREPGAKDWELKKVLGKRYDEIVDLLNQELEKMGLEVKRIGEDEDGPTRYYATMKGNPRLSDRTFGWRIDDMASLTIALSYIQAKRGKASVGEVEELLKEKLPKWRVDRNLNKFTKMGYLSEDDGMLSMDWRAEAEIDHKELLEGLLEKEEEESDEK